MFSGYSKSGLSEWIITFKPWLLPRIQGRTGYIRGGGSMQKVGGLKYLAPNINVYVLMIFTAFSLKSGGALAPPIPPPMYMYTVSGVLEQLDNFDFDVDDG